ncbi:MAG: hypothetical protein QOF83_1170 [Solirubrobacteraceae bacterium]|jgi:hypothetical protein|nr:hypothetical protein [Solirubrobacteraceae bacterium]
MSGAALRFEDLIGLWQEGERRLSQSEPADRAAQERVIEAVVGELRHRLGGPFSVQELARLYLDQGTDWVFSIATRVAPNHPAAWDLTTVAGAGFARYAREAGDYMIGRRPGDIPRER